jgi:lichenan operon transcriptional antiterminator
MLKKQNDIINLLNKSEHDITSNEIAAYLNISKRSVINYIHDINKDEKIIYSSNKGYKLLEKQNKLTEDLQSNDYLSRSRYVIKKILIDSMEVNIFDLCEDLYTSYSTIKLDIIKWNKVFSVYNIKFYTRNNFIKIAGDETAKRRLVSKVIFDETENNFIDLKSLTSLFRQEDINLLEKIIIDISDEHEIFINDFAYKNIVFHLLITIDRIKKGETINSKVVFQYENSIDELIVTRLINDLEINFEIKLNYDEQSSIYILFKSNTNYNISATLYKNNIDSIISEKVFEVTKNIVNQVDKIFTINLNNDIFVNKFSLHLQALKQRSDSNRFNRNPLLNSIKSDCPIIYEIAIYISLLINESFKTPINEDEIAYIAIHIGSEVDRQNKSLSKVKCVFFSPNYLNTTNEVCNKILYRLGNKIEIVKVVTEIDELNSLEYDLLLSNLEINNINNNSITIPPFINENVLLKIENKVNEVNASRKKVSINKYFDTLFNEELLFTNLNLSNKNDVIHFLCENLLNLEYIDKDFEESVLHRESISSTAFGQFAVPHAINAYGYKSTIAVIISENGIIWDDKRVFIVLLPIVCKFDKTKFTAIYEYILTELNNTQIQQLSGLVKSTKDLKTFLINM